MKYEIKEPCASCQYSDIHILNHYVFDDVCDVPEEGTGTQSLYCSHEQICSKLKEYEEKEKFDVLKNRKKQDIYGTWISVDDHLPDKDIYGTWISVDDHLPDKDKYDWVLVQNWIDDVKGYFCVPHVAELRDGKWYDTEADGDMESAYMIKVTHWMPLPPFPKGL